MASRSPEDPVPSTSSGGPTTTSGGPTQGDCDEPMTKRHLYTSEVVAMWNLSKVIRELSTREQCVAFAESNDLVQKEKKCRTHRVPMKVTYSTNRSLGSWICTKGTCKGRGRQSRTDGTFFENIKIEMQHVFYMIYAFAHNWSYVQAIHEDPYKYETEKKISEPTICDWYNYCREVVVIYYLEKTQDVRGKIGGPGKIVQIDESKFGKRKYNKGRHIDGHWVLGLIEDGSEDLRLEVCPDNVRSADVLVPLIQKHVEPGTTVHTDYWKAYDCLGEYGYIHKKVNHSDPDNPFIAPDGVHTQRIESQWRVAKKFFRSSNYTNCKDFADLIVEYQWRRNVIKEKKDPFLELVEAIKYGYKIK